MAELNRLDWAASSTFALDDHYVGVRSNTVEADELLRQVLAQYLVEGVEAPANYSLRVGGSAKVGREFSQVYRSSTLIVRRRTPAEAIDGLLHHMAQLRRNDSDGFVRVRATALWGPAGVLLAPPPLRQILLPAASRLARIRLRMIDSPVVRIDPASAEVVLGPPPLDLGSSAPLRRVPITGWCFFGTEGAVPVTGARTLALAASTLTGLAPSEGQAALDALELALRSISPAIIASTELVDLLVSLQAAA